MTPNELLSDVVSRFPVLLHDEPDALASLLRKALAKYQELAGVQSKFRVQEHELNESLAVIVPSDFASRIAVKDAKGRYVPSEQWDDTLEFRLTDRITFPLTVVYLQNLLAVDFDAFQLPVTCISLLGEYLELLISIPNAERQRRIAVAGKLDVTDIATEADLATRKVELENSMRLNRAIVQPISLL